MFPYSRPLVYFTVKSKPPSVFLWCHHPKEDNQITSCLPWTQCVCYLHSLILYTFKLVAWLNFHLTLVLPMPFPLYHHQSEGRLSTRKTWTSKKARIPSHYPFIVISQVPAHTSWLSWTTATPASWEEAERLWGIPKGWSIMTLLLFWTVK